MRANINQHTLYRSTHLVDWEPIVLKVASLLIQRMARFMNSPRDALHEIMTFVSSGHAHIGGVGTSSKGMHRHVKPPIVQVKAKVYCQLVAQGRLYLWVKGGLVLFTIEPCIVRGVGRRTQRCQQRH